MVGCTLAMALPSTAFASNDPLFAQQWGLAQIGAASAWNSSTGAGISVGIVDTGVDLQHEDLAGQVLMSTNCIGANADPSKCTGTGQDDNGHGTHVAGIVAALKDNGKGGAGVAPSAKLIVAKALDANGAGADADVQAGIMWVVDHGAKVVNLSLGDGSSLPLNLGSTGGISAPMTAGIEYAWSHGAIPVLAAGNNGGGLLSGGLLGGLLGAGGNANFGTLHAIIAGATGPSGAMAAYSSPLSNDAWAVAAPGGANDGNAADDVMSTWWAMGKTNQYLAIAGTSMATPHVAGAVADVLATGLGQQAAVDRILTSADKGVACGTSCAGLLDVSAAVGRPATAPPTGGTATGSSGNLLGSLLGLLGL
ncbi:MAG: serine protease [Actinomycetota bacterium]|nr:serine protease [Actinomycetota bacterium]